MLNQVTKELLLGSILLTVFSEVQGKPTCRTIGDHQNEVVCTTGATDYVLKRGLVSDNNRTTKITLRHCEISSINLESFNGLFYLKYLDLSDNKLTKLRLGVLDGARQVTHLNLSYNYMESFDLGLFDQKPNLETLDLKKNVIKNLELGIFDPLKKLNYLDLSDNQIVGQDLSPFIFDACKKIKYLDFSRNIMSDAPENLLHALRELEVLKLDRCSFTDVPKFVQKKNLRTMKTLVLSTNKIKTIESQATFGNLESLEELDLTWNEIENINENIFKLLTKLKILILRKNLLKSLGAQQFQNMINLRRLDLSHNKIVYITPNSLRGTSIEMLNLSDNRFTYLQDNFCLELKNSGVNLKKFFFNDNPWQCACLKELLKEVKLFKVEYSTVKYEGKVKVCVTSKEFTCKRDRDSNDFYNELYYTQRV